LPRDPHDINAIIRGRTARAVLWAMSMHPDDRPPDVQTFEEALFGKGARRRLGRPANRSHTPDITSDLTQGMLCWLYWLPRCWHGAAGDDFPIDVGHVLFCTNCGYDH
jgi:hypothetical protein